MIKVFREPSFLKVDGRRLAYNEVCPTAPKGTILLLTGLAAKRYGWYHQLDEFGRYYRQLQAGMSHDVAQQLDRIQAPTLVIHGDVDPLVPSENGDYLAKHIKEAKHIVYRNVGHVPIFECPEQFNRDVLAFLES